MSHPRQAIRTYVNQLLETGITITGITVSSDRFQQLSQMTLPAMLVYAQSDQSAESNLSDAPRIYKRTISLVVEIGYSSSTESPDDDIDAAAREVEALLENDSTLGGLVNEVVYRDTQFTVDTAQSPPMMSAVMSFDVQYDDDIMEQVSNDLSTIHTDWNLTTEPDQQNEAEDIITYTP